jgi:hypothetical protein
MRRARTIVAIHKVTCAIPVSVRCANAQLPSFGGVLLLESTAFILNLVHVPRKFLADLLRSMFKSPLRTTTAQ